MEKENQRCSVQHKHSRLCSANLLKTSAPGALPSSGTAVLTDCPTAACRTSRGRSPSASDSRIVCAEKPFAQGSLVIQSCQGKRQIKTKRSIIGEALYFLATSKFTTGVILDVDGGHQIRQYALPNELYAEMKRMQSEEVPEALSKRHTMNYRITYPSYIFRAKNANHGASPATRVASILCQKN